MSGAQWLRRCSLLVANDSEALDLSEMHIKFWITQSDIQTPNVLNARVYNLSDQTAAKVQKEYTQVVLQAGYENGPFGVIFQGTIVQTRWGKETPVDRYLDIVAADGDLAYNQAVVNTSLAAGATADDHLKVLMEAAKSHGVTLGYVPPANGEAPEIVAGGVAIRGKTLYGMWRDLMRDHAKSRGVTWSIQNGVVHLIPLTGYLPGEAVKLTPKTGMIGMPEQTQEGIKVRCLINPKLRVGGLVQIDSSDIQRAARQVDYASMHLDQQKYETTMRIARIDGDGFYRLYVADYTGDTRGNDWYADLTCLAVDMSAPGGPAAPAGATG